MAAQCCNGLLRRGHRSRRCRPCLVRMAVSARARRFTPGGFCLPVAPIAALLLQSLLRGRARRGERDSEVV
jgi:hypothetical protein